MADPQRKRPQLRAQSSDEEYTPENMPDDALIDAVMYERALLLRHELEKLVTGDMERRVVEGEKAIDFCTERVVREALARNFRAKTAVEEDVDEAVMVETEMTAARIAHDLNLRAGDEDRTDDSEFEFAVDIAREVVMKRANATLSSPILADFPQGARREVDAARSLLSSPMRRRYARLARALRGLPK